VESMNQIAHALGKLTVAECVENEETMQILRQMGVDRAQGNHIARPSVSLTNPPPTGTAAGAVVLSL
jgi:EAL domain-containing protein (putative c-di-GMP-specific phosphodiesterase class I)